MFNLLPKKFNGFELRALYHKAIKEQDFYLAAECKVFEKMFLIRK